MTSKLLRQALCLLLLLCLLPGPALGRESRLPAGPVFRDDQTPLVIQLPEEGYWGYQSQNLRVEITRCTDAEKPLIWFETHIYCRGQERLTSYLSNPDHPGRGMSYPMDIARKNGFVLAFSDDFVGFRYVQAKARKGLIIRGGRVYSDTPSKKLLRTMPNLDVLAYYADGSMKAYLNGEKDAETLLSEGVTDVWCFGPVLLSGGELSDIMQENGYRTLQPRQALGMIEPGHYLLLTVKGRTKDSQGVPMRWLAERMQAFGVQEAINLDGGNTVALVFMGQLLTAKKNTGNQKLIRTMSSMIGVGYDPSVQEADQ